MKVSVLLADKGTPNPQAGTLNVLNLGWTQTVLRPVPVPAMGPVGLVMQVQLLTPPHAVVAFFEVEHQHCNHPIELVLELVDQDGHPVAVPGPAAGQPQPMRISQIITVTSPAGVPIGAPGAGNTMLEIIPGLPLQPGVYSWRVELAGQTEEDWCARFYVQPPQQQPAITFVPPAAPPIPPVPLEGDE